jgi:hypothetical protein
MFKNYLTYQIALSFERACSVATQGWNERSRESLMTSVKSMVHHFARSIHTQDRKEESKHLFVTLICLRDCRETLDAVGWLAKDAALESQYQVLHQRLEQLCEKACKAEGGQFRMLG